MTIFGHDVVTSNPQNKVSSCFHVYIYFATTHGLHPWLTPLDLLCIHTDFGNIVHEGRYISTGFHHCRWRCDRWQRHPGSTKQGRWLTLRPAWCFKQGEFLFSCIYIYFSNHNHVLTLITSWELYMYLHVFWKYHLQRTTDSVLVNNDVVVFLVVRCSV
jgi:hypothetical protein